MGAVAALAGTLVGGAADGPTKEQMMATLPTFVGYSKRHHGWNKSRKLKGYMRGQQPRRSKAARRARAA